METGLIMTTGGIGDGTTQHVALRSTAINHPGRAAGEQERKHAWARGEAPVGIAAAMMLFDRLTIDAQMEAILCAEAIVNKERP